MTFVSFHGAGYTLDIITKVKMEVKGLIRNSLHLLLIKGGMFSEVIVIFGCRLFKAFETSGLIPVTTVEEFVQYHNCSALCGDFLL